MHTRLEIIKNARMGGSISPEAAKELDRLIAAGNLTIRTGIDIQCASWIADASMWKVSVLGACLKILA